MCRKSAIAPDIFAGELTLRRRHPRFGADIHDLFRKRYPKQRDIQAPDNGDLCVFPMCDEMINKVQARTFAKKYGLQGMFVEIWVLLSLDGNPCRRNPLGNPADAALTLIGPT